MKKIIILIMVLLPFNCLAYSNYIIPGGQSLGIEVKSDGVMVVGFYKINNKYNRNNLKVGDSIIKINDEQVDSINDLVSLIEKHVNNNEVKMTIRHDKKIETINFKLIKIDNQYKTGLYVKDSITGIGTLTYIDPESKIFGALGHEIADNNSGSIVEIKSGQIFRTSVTSIDRSERGSAGSKNAKFYINDNYGLINKNTKKGIYGIYNGNISDYEVLEVGKYEEIKIGSAYIYTVLKGEIVEKYEINIDRVSNTDTKAIHFSIMSNDLINQTGGIVQGMSGSPIIQNNKIIGAVTHVIIDNPTTGYGILITKMLEEGEN